MAVRLSAAIMAHPARREMTMDLLAHLDRDVPVIWDREGVETETGARAWAAFDPDATHHLVLQDDAVPCRDLLAGVERLCAMRPDDALGLYVGDQRPSRLAVRAAVARARAEDAAWITHRYMLWGVGIVLPTVHIAGLLASRHDRRYDAWVSKFCQRAGMRVAYPWPSPVDHRGDDSLLEHSAIRRAHEATSGSLLDQCISGREVAI